MKKSLRVFLLYFFLMLADGLLTFYNTPDLNMEANPLVTVFHLGWGAIITANVIVFVLVFMSCKYSFDIYKTIVADVNNLKEYDSQIFFNRPDRYRWNFYKLPKNWKPLWALLGYAGTYGLCIAAIIRILEWLMITFDIHSNIYNRINHALFGRLDICVCITIAIILGFHWINMEYKKSQFILLQTKNNEIYEENNFIEEK